MSQFASRLATVLLALTLTLSGAILGAIGSAPTLPHPIAPFGCYT
jgi:hypothetical protein